MCYFFACKYTIFLLKKYVFFFVFFNRDIIVNLYQLHFSILSFFFSTKQISFHLSTFPSSEPNTNRRKLNFFSILPLFYPLLIFYSPTFTLLQPNKPLVLSSVYYTEGPQVVTTTTT